MSEESTTSNSREQRITIDKPEKDPRRVAAGKRLREYNKMAGKKKESGETPSPKEPSHSESNFENDDEGMSGTTKTLLLLGVAGLGYYLYTTTTTNNGKEENKKNVQQPVIQNNNNDVQENTVNRLRSLKN